LLRRILGPKEKGVTKSRRRLRKEELHKLYTTPNITRAIKLG